MRIYIAGHGHCFESSADFCKWLEKHDSHFLVSFAYPDMGRLKYARSVRLKRQKLRKTMLAKKGKK